MVSVDSFIHRVKEFMMELKKTVSGSAARAKRAASVVTQR